MYRSGWVGAAVVVLVAAGLVSAGAAPAAAATTSWSGAGATASWSDAANWGGVAPVDGDDLVFPAGSRQPASVNDRADASYRSITVGDTRQIDGARVRLGAGGVRAAGALGLSAPVVLAADQAWTADRSVIHVHGSLDLAGHRLDLGAGDLDGGGALHATSPILGGEVRLSGSATLGLFTTFSTAAVTSPGGGSLQLFGGEVHAPVRLGRHATIAGSGAVGDLAIDDGNVIPGSDDPVLEVRGDLTMGGGTRFTLTERPGHHLRVTGRVHLDGARLFLVDDGRPLGDGRLLVDNAGAVPVGGTFAAVPDGGRFISGGVEYRVTYRGGDGNDVVATPLRRGARPRVVVEDASALEGTTALARARIEPPSSDPVHFRLGTVGGSATFRDYDANHQSFGSVAHVGAVELPIRILDDPYRERP
jgi:hypothetical protein